MNIFEGPLRCMYGPTRKEGRGNSDQGSYMRDHQSCRGSRSERIS